MSVFDILSLTVIGVLANPELVVYQPEQFEQKNLTIPAIQFTAILENSVIRGRLFDKEDDPSRPTWLIRCFDAVICGQFLDTFPPPCGDPGLPSCPIQPQVCVLPSSNTIGLVLGEAPPQCGSSASILLPRSTSSTSSVDTGIIIAIVVPITILVGVGIAFAIYCYNTKYERKKNERSFKQKMIAKQQSKPISVL